MHLFRPILISAVLTVSTSLISTASVQSTSAGADSSFEQRLAPLEASQFPLLSIADCDHQGIIYRSADLTLTLRGPELLATGRDASSRAWRGTSHVNGLGCRVFQADLDGNGQQDLIVYTPGITSRAPYDSTLTILLLNRQSAPIPWSATGRFDLMENGIRQITRTSDGRALILRSYTVGLLMWGGLSHIATAYAAEDGAITLRNGQESGISFPLVAAAQGEESSVSSVAAETDLSTVEVERSKATGQAAHPLFVRYGAKAVGQRTVVPEAHLTADQAANIRVDSAAIEAAQDRIQLSDGSSLDLPRILIIDSAGGDRTIVFDPEGSDFLKLAPNSYGIKPIGKECQGADDCKVFTLRAALSNH